MLVSFLDHLYGVWFTPQQTFKSLKAEPALAQAIVVVIALNLIDIGRRSGLTPTSAWAVLGILWGLITGVIGWLLIAGLLRWLAFCFNRQTHLVEILSLTGFASIPWIFLAPAQAIGGAVGVLLGLAAIVWFWASELYAIAVALDQPWNRVVGLVPLTFLAGFLALNWAFSGIGALLSLT